MPCPQKGIPSNSPTHSNAQSGHCSPRRLHASPLHCNVIAIAIAFFSVMRPTTIEQQLNNFWGLAPQLLKCPHRIFSIPNLANIAFYYNYISNMKISSAEQIKAYVNSSQFSHMLLLEIGLHIKAANFPTCCILKGGVGVLRRAGGPGRREPASATNLTQASQHWELEIQKIRTAA